MDKNTIYLIIGIIAALIVLYLLFRKKDSSNEGPIVSDESMNDVLGQTHVNTDPHSSSNALTENQVDDAQHLREGAMASKVQRLNEETTTPGNFDSDFDGEYQIVTYDQLLNDTNLAGQRVQIEGRLASFFTRDLGVPDATALGSLNPTGSDKFQLVALKFVEEIEENDFNASDQVRVSGILQGLKVSGGSKVPALVVEAIERIN